MSDDREEAVPEELEPEEAEAEAEAEPESNTGDVGEPDAGAHKGKGHEEEHDREGLLAALQAERRKRQERDQLIEELRGQSQKQQQTQQTGEPKLSDFDDYDQYQRALVRYETQQAISAQQETHRRQSVVSDFHGRVEAVTKDRPADYAQRIARAMTDPDLPISQHMASVILEHPSGPDIAYHLEANPAELARISRMSPAMQIAELGGLSEKLRAKGNSVSGAPPPVKPVSGSKGSAAKDPDKMSGSEYRAWRKQRISQRHR